MLLFFRAAFSILRCIKEYLGLLYPTSSAQLAAAEKEILSHLKSPFKTYYVNIGPVVGNEDCKVWTLSMNEDTAKVPIVLVHGMCQGVANWILNLDTIATERPVYAFEIPGFGRSSRPDFSTDGMEAEKQMVDCIEAWRKEMKLDKFILLGFSLGGFLATSYAFRFPKRLVHLILVDPWGFPEGPKRTSLFFESGSSSLHPDPKIPLYIIIMTHLTRLFHTNPFILMRIFGMMRFDTNIVIACKYFPWLAKFSEWGKDGIAKMADYTFHCNSQNPTGEAAIVAMSSKYGMFWAKFPMTRRISLYLAKEVPITFVYGTDSFLHRTPTSEIQKIRPTSYVDEQLINGASHECHVFESEIFNKIVIKVCDQCDQQNNEDCGII